VQRDFERDEPRRRLHPDEEYWGQDRSFADQGYQAQRRGPQGGGYDRDFEPDEYGERPGEPYGQRGRSGYSQERGDYRGEQGRFERRRGQGGYERGFDPRGSHQMNQDQWSEPDRERRTAGEPYGRSNAPYDQGEISSWYGGDSGMGDYGASQSGPGAHQPFDYGRSSGQRQSGGQQERDQFERRQYDRREQDRGPYGRATFEEGQHGGRFRIERGNRSGASFSSGGSEQPERSDWRGGSDWRGSWDRAMRGPHTGRGPRGYQRSDERIHEEVCEILTHHGEINASDMDVEVHNGEVFLRGFTDSGMIRRLTEEVVEGVPGVRDVRNELRVRSRTGYTDVGHEDVEIVEPRRGPSGREQASQQQSAQPRYERTARGGALDDDAPAYGTGVASTSGVVSNVGQTQHGDAGGDHIGSRFTVHESMEVVGTDGESVGQVVGGRGTDFRLCGPTHGDIYVPFSAIRTVDGDRVMLEVRSGDVERQGWPTPDLTGTSQQRPSGGG